MSDDNVSVPDAGVVENLSCPDAYMGISQLVLSDEERATLTAPMGDDELDILPSGEVYPTQMIVRRRLNQVFGPGGWAMMPRGGYQMVDVVQDEQGRTTGGSLIREYALFVRGHYIGEAIGEHRYVPSNDRMSYATACEAVKSSALKRLCKDLGIAAECWDKRWCTEWKRTHAIQVQVRQRNGQMKAMWRRIDADPFPCEQQGSATNPALNPQRKSETQAAPAPANGNGQPRPVQTQPARAVATAQQAPPAQPAGGKSSVQGVIERDVFSKPAGNRGGYRHGIKLGGAWYNTFSQTIADDARNAFAAGAEVLIEYHVTQYGNDIDSLVCLFPAMPAGPADGDGPMDYPDNDMPY